MRRFLAILAFLAAALAAAPTHAYRLPPCAIADDERSRPAEEVLASHRAAHDALAAEVNVIRLDDHRRNPRVRLEPRERRAAKDYDRILARLGFWDDVVGLKRSLLALHGAHPPADAVPEADAMAKAIIETLYDLSQEWKIGGSALFNNALINWGKREKGFCYHFAAELRKALAGRHWVRFESRWGAAWEGTFRESNALVVTARGRPFESGIVVDPWRTAGRPFWTAEKGDRFPWIEKIGVEENYDVE